MSIKPEVIDALLAAGATAEMIAAAWKADIASEKKSTGADRQKRYRERNALRNVTSRDVTPSPQGSPSSSSPPTPPLITTPPPNPPLSPSLRSGETRAGRASVADEAKAIAGEFASLFWPAWPHKVGKPDAAKAFLRARRSGSDLEDMLAGVDRYIRDKPPDRPWLNPSTFLNQRRWEDQPAQVQTGPPRHDSRDGVASLYGKLMRGELFDDQTGENQGDFGNVLSLSVVPPERGSDGDDTGVILGLGERVSGSGSH